KYRALERGIADIALGHKVLLDQLDRLDQNDTQALLRQRADAIDAAGAALLSWEPPEETA
ncbi:MAG TPA: hypothetical protein VIT92_06100, partial [Burkholderiaceae bacterium]